MPKRHLILQKLHRIGRAHKVSDTLCPGYRSAKQREKLMHKNGKKTETIYYDPNDPKYLKGSSTYIGPQKK